MNFISEQTKRTTLSALMDGCSFPSNRYSAPQLKLSDLPACFFFRHHNLRNISQPARRHNKEALKSSTTHRTPPRFLLPRCSKLVSLDRTVMPQNFVSFPPPMLINSRGRVVLWEGVRRGPSPSQHLANLVIIYHFSPLPPLHAKHLSSAQHPILEVLWMK